jgi:hemoglobin
MTRAAPELTFLAAVSLRFGAPRAVGEAPDGCRFDFQVEGRVAGPALTGHFPACAAYLLVDPDGIGTIHVRAPLLLDDGAIAELEATGRYDFGRDGYQRARALDLPNSALGWCPRLFTAHERYSWLNRAQCLGIGELRPRQATVDYDLFMIAPPRPPSATGSQRAPIANTPSSSQRGSLYERLGGRAAIFQLMSASIESLHHHEQLGRQNPKVAAAASVSDLTDVKQKVTDFACRLTGGPCTYTGRTMRASHAHLDITEADWVLFWDDTVRLLNEHGVPMREREELLALLDTFKSEIVSDHRPG